MGVVFVGKRRLSRARWIRHLERAYQVQQGLGAAYSGESHADCQVWAIWRMGME